MARHHLDVNTSVRPNTLELDGCDPELLAHLAANDRDTIDENAVSGERPVVTTRPPPPDFDRRVSILRLRPFPEPEIDEPGERTPGTDGPGGESRRVPCDSSEEVTRPLPRTAPAPAARTALRIEAGPTIPPPPLRAQLPAIHLSTSPRSVTPRPRRRRKGDAAAMEWAAKPRTTAPLRRGARDVAPGSLRVAWPIALAGALGFVSGQTAIGQLLAERWRSEVSTEHTDGSPERATAAGTPEPVASRPATGARPTSAPVATRPAAPPSAPVVGPADPAPSPAPPGKFDARAARQALVDAASRAAACTDPHGGSATAAVTFVPDGRAATARVGGRYTGTTVAGCIEQEMKGARVTPFVGQPITMIHVVRLPGDAKGVR